MDIARTDYTENPVEIVTFGEFDICHRGKSILDRLGRSYKILDLLKFFITFKGKRIQSDTLISCLFEHDDFADPKSVLRAQVFRLKKSLEDFEHSLGAECSHFKITHCNGSYIFDTSNACRLDYEMFESLHLQPDLDSDVENTLHRFKSCLHLYKGDYLSNNASVDWVLPVRNRYSRLYQQYLNTYVDLLKEHQRYDDILEMCEHAITLQPFEEVFHAHYMGALLDKGMLKQASSHYEYTTYKLYREYDIKPSPMMKTIYRQVQMESQNKHLTDLSSMETLMCDDDISGAIACDTDYFRFAYNLEKRKARRDDLSKMVGLITVMPKTNSSRTPETAMAHLKDVLKCHLRRGDLYSLWNTQQIAILLAHTDTSQFEIVKERISAHFSNSCEYDVSLSFSFHPIEKALL